MNKTIFTRNYILLALLFAVSIAEAQWNGTGNIYYNVGNVGVETSSPIHKLHITTGVNDDRSIGFSNADNHLSSRSSIIYTAGGSGIFQNRLCWQCRH